MCTPVCAALGYGPQAEFDEQVARKDAEVRRLRRRLLPRDRWGGASFFCIRFFLLPKSILSSPAERVKDLDTKSAFFPIRTCVLSERRNKRRRRPTTTTTTHRRRRLFCSSNRGHHHRRFGTPTTVWYRRKEIVF